MPRHALQLIRFVLLLAGSAVFIVPLLWMFATALKPLDQTMTEPPTWVATKTVTDLDGEPVEVGVGKIADGAQPSDDVRITAAYQWVMEQDGQTLPVRLIKDHDDGNADIETHYHLQTRFNGRVFPVRTVDGADPLALAGQVEIAAVSPDGSMRRRTVHADDIQRVPDTTDEAVSKSYSFTVLKTVPRDALTRRYVPWNGRQAYAHLQTENRTAPLSALTQSPDPQWSNFPKAMDAMGRFWRTVANTLIICLLTVIGTAASSAVVAYGFSRVEWPGRDKVFLIVLGTMMIPAPVVMVPLYGLFKELGWIGTLRPLWVPAFFAGAFNVFLLRQFFKTIPKELSEAARIDGCSEFRIFLQVIVPLAKPAITVVALFQFLYSWNDFLGPLIYLTDEKDYTLALALQAFQSQQGGTQWHYLMAASALVLLPIIGLFFLTQRTFIEGVSMSGLKG